MGQQSEGSTLKSEGGSCEADASFFPIISHRSDTAWKIGYGLEFPVSSNLRRVFKKRKRASAKLGVFDLPERTATHGGI